MPIGLIVGAMVVVAFELAVGGFSFQKRREKFVALTQKAELGHEVDPNVEEKLLRNIDGLANAGDFWTGGAMHLQVSKAQYTKAYEMLALVCALLLSICVTFYTASPSDHMFGIIACVANCALWMATLSSAFFAVMVNTCETDEQLALLIGLYGPYLMRTPMMLFVWGTSMIFLEFIFFFKENVDAGLGCTLCLTACFCVAPLFFHTMHKLGWAVAVVQEEAECQRRDAKPPTADDLRTELKHYVASKGSNVLALDREEFLHVLKIKPGARVTSVQRAFSKQLFDEYVEGELAKLTGEESSRRSRK